MRIKLASVSLLLLLHLPARADERGPYPNNEITTQPVAALAGGRAGLMTTVAALQRSLTALQQLALQLRQARWNVSGTLFYPLREMLEIQHRGVDRDIDRLAERLLGIGASADGRVATLTRTALLPEMPGGFLDDAAVLTWFTIAYKTVGEDLKQAIRDVATSDPSSAALLQEIDREIGIDQWQMRAAFQSTATDPNKGGDLNDGNPVQRQAPPK